MDNGSRIRTMTIKFAFKAMYKAIGFSDDAVTELTNTEVVDSVPKLSRITSARTSKICKAIHSSGGGGRGGTGHGRGGAQSFDCSGRCPEYFPCFAHNSMHGDQEEPVRFV